MASNHLIPCRPLLLPSSIFPSIQVFSNESALCIRWPKYWSFSSSISPFNEYSGLISFRIVWFDLLAVQGTLKSLLPHHSSKASVLRLSAFFMFQASHPGRDWGQEEKRMTEDEMASPTRWTWVWVNSRSWCWTGRPGVLQFMESQGVRHNWATKLNWTELSIIMTKSFGRLCYLVAIWLWQIIYFSNASPSSYVSWR